jgi:uncharacterized 2Fe-2S/4Fe-4S cluster protein (DUF4445 family)
VLAFQSKCLFVVFHRLIQRMDCDAKMLSRAGGFNKQIQFGDNVLTRIDAARTADALAAMQSAVVSGTIAPLLQRACERAGRKPSRLAGGAIAGNTTMLHLLMGEDPSSLGVAPFVPRFITGRRLTAADIHLTIDAIDPDMPLQLLPGIAAYVGADITAGVIATGMLFDPWPSLLVDFGTNGEMVLQRDGKLIACATAAGPAFEGSGLSHGSRAIDGAISGIAVSLDPFRVEMERIGGRRFVGQNGICGSAYVDFLASARRCGFLLNSGRFNLDTWGLIPPRHRIEKDGRAFRLADETSISEHDISVLLQAKAAVGAGIESLLKTVGIEAAEVSRLYLAGGFGMYLNVGHAIAAGLLPGFRNEQVRVVGNTALAGAALVLLDRTKLDLMEAVRARVEVLELNLQEEFEDRFIDHLRLP